MKKIILGVAAAAILVTGSMFVIAQRAGKSGGPGFGHGGRHGGQFGTALRGLDLTDEQKAKVKEITEASRSNAKPLMDQMHDNHAKIRSLGTDGKFDQTQVEALATEAGNLTAKMIVEKEKTKAQIFAILTDEQKAKAAEMKSKFEEKTGGRRPHFEKPASEF